MTEGMYKLVMDQAVNYTNAKGRMPRDVHELRAWLREFAACETQRADLIMKAYKEHVAATPYRTFIVGKDDFKVSQ